MEKSNMENNMEKSGLFARIVRILFEGMRNVVAKITGRSERPPVEEIKAWSGIAQRRVDRWEHQERMAAGRHGGTVVERPKKEIDSIDKTMDTIDKTTIRSGKMEDMTAQQMRDLRKKFAMLPEGTDIKGMTMTGSVVLEKTIGDRKIELRITQGGVDSLYRRITKTDGETEWTGSKAAIKAYQKTISDAFESCDRYARQEEKTELLGVINEHLMLTAPTENAVLNYYGKESTVKISNDIRKVASEAFSNCENVNIITMGNVEKAGMNAFGKCGVVVCTGITELDGVIGLNEVTECIRNTQQKTIKGSDLVERLAPGLNAQAAKDLAAIMDGLLEKEAELGVIGNRNVLTNEFSLIPKQQPDFLQPEQQPDFLQPEQDVFMDDNFYDEQNWSF